MPCACDQCRQHAVTLGLAQKVLSRATLRKAFLAAAKQWHPDRFERDPARRHDAEEHFKLVQVAYRELWEHLKRPERPTHDPWPGPPPDVPPPPPPKPAQPPLPPIFFGDARGCYVAPRFPRPVRDILATHLQEAERAVAFVDFSSVGDLSEYLLLTSYRIFVRDRLGIVALLWYTDLGEIRLIDLHRDGRPGLWQRIVTRFSGIERRYALEIFRHTGQPFYTAAGQADDTVKKVIYNFLRQLKSQPRA